MQTEKEFKELAQCWVEDEDSTPGQYIDEILELMWRSYNQGEQDKIQDANETWEKCKNERT